MADFKTINRAAAKNTKALLGSGFLDSLGTPSYNAAPLELNNVEEVLLKYGALLVKGFSEELAKADANASGSLTDSMRFEYTKNGQAYKVSIYMNSYADYVDQGVQGISSAKSKNLTSPFKFKFARPSAAHVEALEKWIAEKNVTAVITVPKGIKDTVLSPKSLAYAIGTSIKQRGLKATYFKKKVIDSLIDEMKVEIAKAIGIDITVNIKFS